MPLRSFDSTVALIADAVEFVLGADEEAVLGDADGGADRLVIAGRFGAVAHVDGVEEFKLIAAGFDDEDFAPEVHAVDFAVGSGGGGLQFGAGREFTAPDDFAGGGFDATDGFAIAVEDIEAAFVKERGGDVAGDFFGIGGPGGFGEALAAEFEAEDRVLFGGAGECESAASGD